MVELEEGIESKKKEIEDMNVASKEAEEKHKALEQEVAALQGALLGNNPNNPNNTYKVVHTISPFRSV